MRGAILLVAVTALAISSTQASAVSGTESDFCGEWIYHTDYGNESLTNTYLFYSNGTGIFIHEGTSGGGWTISETFSWTVCGNGTVGFVYDYGTYHYAYSFNEGKDQLTFTYEGGTQMTYNKTADPTDEEEPEEETESAFCGLTMLPMSVVVFLAAIPVMWGRVSIR